jgi:hypothetical protein
VNARAPLGGRWAASELHAYCEVGAYARSPSGRPPAREGAELGRRQASSGAREGSR